MSGVVPIGRQGRLPAIRLGADLARVVDDAIGALEADSGIYQRDGALMRVVRVAEADPAAELVAVGTPQLRSVSAASLRERLTRIVRFLRYDARVKDWIAALPPVPVVQALADRGEWKTVRPITGIIETPSMRPDGSVIDLPGYDSRTGYVFEPKRDYPAVPTDPTRDDAARCLRMLQEPWTDFPVTCAEGATAPIAALLTLVGRPAIVGAVPGLFVDASTRGSGKSLIARTVTTLAHGREAALVTWPETAEELEKLLGAYALAGASVVLFDNVVRSFGGGALDKLLTATNRVQLRVLGKSEAPELLWRGVVIATGNNADIAADTARRVLVCRLEPSMERPEERDPGAFKIADLDRWALRHHPRLAVAALTLLRAYVVAGRPRQDLQWGSFQPWADLVASAIVWAGGPNVLDARATASDDEDETTAAARVLLQHWGRLAPDGITAAGAIAALYTPEHMRGEAAPDGFDDLREAIEALAPPKKGGRRPEPRALGYVLRKLRGRVLGGLRLDKGGELQRAGKASWVVR